MRTRLGVGWDGAIVVVGLLSMLAGASLSFFWPNVAPVYSLLWLIYLTATFVVASILAHSHGWKYAPFLPLVFAILHISWGSGFWWGFLRPALPSALPHRVATNSDNVELTI